MRIINCSQSGFQSGDACVLQLLSITYKIYKSFDANPSLEVKFVFLDIFKAFDWVWHDSLLYKLKLLGICSRCYNSIQSFLDNRDRSQCQSWKRSLAEAGVPDVYIYDLPKGLCCNAKLLISSLNLNEDIFKITQWIYQWKMSFNPDITKHTRNYIIQVYTLIIHEHDDSLFKNILVSF